MVTLARSDRAGDQKMKDIEKHKDTVVEPGDLVCTAIRNQHLQRAPRILGYLQAKHSVSMATAEAFVSNNILHRT